MSNLTLISDIPHDTGWGPVLHMEALLARYTQAEVIDISSSVGNRWQSLLYSCLPRSRSANDRVAVCVTWNGFGARKFPPILRRLGGFSRVALWIVDSFWTDAVHRERLLIGRQFDHVVHMQRFDSDFYRKLFGNRALNLEWGSDVLDLGSAGPDRSCDLQRIGRQPPEWDDDAVNERDCAIRGLRYRGRPAMDAPADDVVPTLMTQHYGTTKFVLAHSNVRAPANYTHPTKAYVTGRWTDALASGATVAGMPPEGDLDLIDWPGALLHFPSLDRAEGLDLLAAAARAWTPAAARKNHANALKRLDWRWRFRDLLAALHMPAPLLDDEIIRLESRIASMTADAS